MSLSISNFRQWLSKAKPFCRLVHKPQPRLFVRTITAVFSLYMLVSIPTNMWRDPYWFWRSTPEWLVKGKGHNRNFDVKSRDIKPVHMGLIKADNVIIGSSRVYRGIDPRCVVGQTLYNGGISSLYVDEVAALVPLVAKMGSNTTPPHIIWGMDYFSFAPNSRTFTPLNPHISETGWRLERYLYSLFSVAAWSDARLSKILKYPGDGYWQASGMKWTLPRSPERASKYTGFDYPHIRAQPRAYTTFTDILDDIQRRHIKLTLYLSPMSQVQLSRLERIGSRADFDLWRKTIRQIAEKYNIPYQDMTDNHPFINLLVPKKGSSRYWIDADHFTPVVGCYILQKLGFKVRQNQPPYPDNQKPFDTHSNLKK